MKSDCEFFVIEHDYINLQHEDFECEFNAWHKHLANRGLKNSFEIKVPFYDEVKS